MHCSGFKKKQETPNKFFYPTVEFSVHSFVVCFRYMLDNSMHPLVVAKLFKFSEILTIL